MSSEKIAFIAGASGVIGRNLSKLLVKDGWIVYGTTRDENKKIILENLGVQKMIAQSIAFVYEPDNLPHSEESALLNFDDPVYGTTSKAVASLENQVLNAPFIGVILRNGLLYGEGTGFDEAVEYLPSVNVEATSNAVFLAINCSKNSIYNIADDDERLLTEKAKNELKWNPDFRIEK